MEKKFGGRECSSSEAFVEHFREKYPDSKMPIWIAVELWDFGMLSHYYEGLKYPQKREISSKYGINNPEVMVSWLKCLNVVRNNAAHHARLWNRPLINQPKRLGGELAPELQHVFDDTFINKRVYSAFSVMQFLLRYACDHNTWAENLSDLLERFPENHITKKRNAGFLDNWSGNNVWGLSSWHTLGTLNS